MGNTQIFNRKLMALLTVFIMLCSIATSTQVNADDLVNLGTFTYATADDLGSANSYMVFSNEFTDANHSEGVFATKYLKLEGHVFGITSNVESHINKGESYIYVEDLDNISEWKSNNGVDCTAIILPDGCALDYTHNNNNGVSITYNGSKAEFNTVSSQNTKNFYKLSETTYKIDFAKAFSALKTYSDTQAQLDTTSEGTKVTVSPAGTDWNNQTITVDCVAGKNVVSLTADQLVNYKLIVNGPSDGSEYSVIVNVTGCTAESYTFDRECTVDGISGGYDAKAGNLMFNFPSSYAGTLTFNKSNTGVILAPSAYVICSVTHNGSVYANKVKNQGCEIHQTNFKQFSSSTGTLTLTKTFTGDLMAASAPADLSFTVKCDALSYSKTIKYSEFKNGSYTITGLEAGTYTVEETGAAVTNYTLTTTYTVGTGAAAATCSAAVEKGKTTAVAITNNYVKDKGTLKITKTFTGDSISDDAKKTVTFTVTGPNNYSKTIKYSDFTSGSYTIKDLPVGDYTVTESNATVSGYKVETNYSVTGGKTTVTKDTESAVTVTNKYTKDSDGGKDDGNKDDGNKDDGNKDDGNKDAGNKDDGNKDAGNKDDGNKDDGNKDDDNKDDDNKDDGNKDDDNKDDGNKDNGNKDNGNNDDDNKDNENVASENFAVAIQKNDIDGNAREDTTYVLYFDYTDADGNAKRTFYTGYTTETVTVTNDDGEEVEFTYREAAWATYALADADEWQEIKALIESGKIAGLTTDSTGYAYAYGVKDTMVDASGNMIDGLADYLEGISTESGSSSSSSGSTADASNYTSIKYNFKEICPPTKLLVNTTPIPFEISAEAIEELSDAAINDRYAVIDSEWGITTTSTGEYIIGAAEQVDPEFFIEKVDEDGNAITGAKLKITGTLADGTAFEDTIVSTDDKIKLQLLPGEYVLEEMTVPAGYKKAENISFTVDESGVVTCDGDHIKVMSEGLTAEQYIMFMVDEKADPEKSSGTVSTTVNGATTVASASANATSTTTSTATTSVQTGDGANLILLVILAIASFACIIMTIRLKKQR